MIARLAFLVFPLLCAAAEEREITALARDGTGRLWSISRAAGDLAWLEGDAWPSQTGEALEGATPECLHTLRDGSVLCLWNWGGRQQAALSRQWGAAAPTVTLIAAGLHGARIIERADGALLITEDGPTVVEVPPRGEPRITIIPEAFFQVPPAAGEGDERRYAPTRAIEDERHQVWLWSYALNPGEAACVLQNFVRYENGAVRRHEVPGVEPAARISDMLSADANHLWFAKVGVGLFSLGLDDEKVELMVKPEPREHAMDDINYIEQLFRIRQDCFAVTSPKPSRTIAQPGAVSVQGGVVLGFQHFYTRGAPTGRLLRCQKGEWAVVADGLDRSPRFGWWDRPRVMTDAGLLIGSHEDGPWLTLRPGKDTAIHLGWRTNFPLRDTVTLLVEDTGQSRAVSSTGEMAVFRIEPPGDLPARRCLELYRYQPYLQDARGYTWTFLNGELIRGSGERGKPVPTPDSIKAMIKAGTWLADDQNRGWLCVEGGAAAICDFTTGGWTHFASWDAALVSQLPQGMKLDIPRHPIFSPVYSGRGQIAYLHITDGLRYYDGKAWIKWTSAEISDGRGAVAGPPFFNAAHRLCLPIGDHDWEWEATEAHWKRGERDRTRVSPTFSHDAEPPVPDGCPIESPVSIALDAAGTTWLTSKEGKLYKVAGSRTIQVLAENEPNPFRYGRKFSNLLVDLQGGVLFELERNTSVAHVLHYIRLTPRFPLPKASIEITESKGDRARIRFSTDADPKAEIWYSWQLDDGPWQPLQHRPDFLLSHLANGPHRLQLRAYNAELGTARIPVALEWTMPLPEVPSAGETKAPPPP